MFIRYLEAGVHVLQLASYYIAYTFSLNSRREYFMSSEGDVDGNNRHTYAAEKAEFEGRQQDKSGLERERSDAV